MKQETALILAGVVLMALSIAALWLTRPSDSDVLRCMEYGNMSRATCEVELTR